MSSAHKPANHVGTHSAEADHCHLHKLSLKGKATQNQNTTRISRTLRARIARIRREAGLDLFHPMTRSALEHLPDYLFQRRQSRRKILTQMHAQCAAIALSQYLEVASRLSCFHDTEGELLSRNGNVDGVVASDLQKDSRIGTAFVRLPGRMQEPWTEAEAGGRALLVANCRPG